MKKKERAIKYSKWTTTFFYVFGVLFILITIAGMVYSYTNLIQLSHEISYSDNLYKSNFWPIFTEVTMVCLGVLILVVRLNKWPKLWLFRFLFYLFALFVLLANGYNTSIQQGFTLIGVVDLIIQEWPVICYLVFIEIALYVITNVINDRIIVESKRHRTTLDVQESTEWPGADEQKHIKKTVPVEFSEQTKKNKLSKIEGKKQLLEVFKNNPSIGQNAAGRMVNITPSTTSNWVRELKQSNQLDVQNGKWVVYESDW